MIITSYYKLEIGQVYDMSRIGEPFHVPKRMNDGRFLGDELYDNYRYLVLREATRDEYEKYMIENYPSNNSIGYNKYFYEISMD